MTLIEFIEPLKSKSLDNSDLTYELWKSNLTVKEKILLSLEIYHLEPSYLVLTTMWFEYRCSNEVNKGYNELIFDKYQTELSDPSKNLDETTTQASLYFDIFEDPERNKEAWNYFLSKSPNDRFIKIMLANSGPVPYELKNERYEKLITNRDFHLAIFKSIRHSCFDNCGQVDKERALKIFKKLNLTDKMDEVDERGFRTFQEVKDYLNGS